MRLSTSFLLTAQVSTSLSEWSLALRTSPIASGCAAESSRRPSELYAEKGILKSSTSRPRDALKKEAVASKGSSRSDALRLGLRSCDQGQTQSQSKDFHERSFYDSHLPPSGRNLILDTRLGRPPNRMDRPSAVIPKSRIRANSRRASASLGLVPVPGDPQREVPCAEDAGEQQERDRPRDGVGRERFFGNQSGRAGDQARIAERRNS